MRERLGIAQGGQLSAMMLDMKRTFDDMVTRFAEGPEMRDRILANPIYQHVSDALAGSGEYAAMEKVYEMLESDQFDLIVLDTPPSQHALDFLAAPRRLTDFLESRLVKLLVHPAFSAGRFGLKIFQGATARVIGVIERVTGVGFLEDISEFLLAFEGMSEGFRERASHVQAMLLGPDSRFVLVAAPSAEAARNSVDFLTDLERTSAPLAGIVINRAHLWSAVSPGTEDDPSTAALRPDDPALSADVGALERALIASGRQGDAGELARAAVNAASQYSELVRLDRHESRDLRSHAAARGLFVRTVPEFPMDVHDLDGLCRIGGYVFGEQADDVNHG
jgi:anion-transporting  ArsA/GET3 family ATPase